MAISHTKITEYEIPHSISEVPTEEVESALKRMKNGTAAGNDEVAVELYRKENMQNICKHLH